MFYDGPPGMTLDLVGSSPNGVDLEWEHPYTNVRPDRHGKPRAPLHPYVYANTNPINMVDPSGLDAQHVRDCLNDAHRAFKRCCDAKASDFDCANRCNALPFWAVGLCWVSCKALQGLASSDCAAGIGLMGIICQFELFRER